MSVAVWLIAFLAVGAGSAVVVLADWTSSGSWDGPERILGYLDRDPLDPATTSRGTGAIVLGSGLAQMQGSCRLYVTNYPASRGEGEDGQHHGWENVEMTAHAMFVNDGELKNFSGFTMVARSNHDEYTSDGCQAFGYLARIYRSTGECAFQKEYYHSPDNTGVVYTSSLRVPCFAPDLPLGVWIGMRFKVETLFDENSVQLQLYLQGNTGESGNGSSSAGWTLAHSLVDVPGSWMSTQGTSVPASCSFQDGDTVLGARNACFFRTDGSNETLVQWRNASIISTAPPTKADNFAPTTTTTSTTTPFAAPPSSKSNRVAATISRNVIMLVLGLSPIFV